MLRDLLEVVWFLRFLYRRSIGCSQPTHTSFPLSSPSVSYLEYCTKLGVWATKYATGS